MVVAAGAHTTVFFAMAWNIFAKRWEYAIEYVLDQDLSRKQTDFGNVVGPQKDIVQSLTASMKERRSIVNAELASISCKHASKGRFFRTQILRCVLRTWI